MAFDFTVDEQNTQITNLRYRTQYKHTKRGQLKQEIKNLRQMYQDLPEDLLVTSEQFSYLLLSLIEFRAIYNAQFPEKAKPIKNKLKSIVKRRLAINDAVPDITYDILVRIEKILGFKLRFSTNYNCFLPENKFYQVIVPSVKKKNKKFRIIYVTYAELKNYQKIGDKFYDKSLCEIIWVNNQNKKNNKDSNYNFATVLKCKVSLRKKKCSMCGKTFDTNATFKYHKSVDDTICLDCNNYLNNYVQPQFNEDTIYGGYHNNRDGFIFTICKKAMENSIPIGMELEMELIANTDKSRNKILFELWQQLGNKDIIFERDGSLNALGVECITNPMTSEYARSYWLPVKDYLPSITQGIYSGNGTNYKFWGIHLTTHKRYWQNLSLGKVINFFYNPHNKQFLKHICQRNTLYGGLNIGDKRMKHTLQYHIDKNASGPNKMYIQERNASVNTTKKSLVEFRAFQCTSKYEEIMKNYDFITALHEWLTTTNTGLSPVYNQFLDWLLVQQIPKYKYLMYYLKQTTHTIANNNKSTLEIVQTPNPWCLQFEHLNISTEKKVTYVFNPR